MLCCAHAYMRNSSSMKLSSLFAVTTVLFMGAATAHAQQSGFPCGNVDYEQQIRSLHPAEVQDAENQLRQETDYLLQHGENRSAPTYIIPVVFHILHDYGTENISDAQIYDQMMILNRDYAKLNADTSAIIPQFQNIASAIGIEFRLATIDPDGNCTNGIDRIATKKTYNADDGSKFNPWPRQKYLNVWVVKTIGSAGVAGYAYYPSSVVGLGLAVDGVLILNDYIGSIGTSSPSHSRALTHEIGHYLNLSHPWGSTNNPGVACGDDGIPDTPRTKGWSFCPTPTQAKVCDTAIVENYQNYMDYSYCSVMFTHDQMIAMHATLNSNVSFRNHLSTLENLVETGTDVVTTPSCMAHADFHPNRFMVCEGGSITFSDDSWGGTVQSRFWDFGPAASPQTSTATNPVVTYNTAGTHYAKLIITGSQGSDSIIKQVVVGVSYGEVIAPSQESFETGDPLTYGWIAVNYGNDAVQWHHSSTEGSTGTSCVKLDNYYNTRGMVDELISPQYDLRYMTGMTLTFNIAFATKTMDTGLVKERLRILVSTNCGQSWTPMYSRVGAQIVSAGVNQFPFSPGNDPVLWRAFSVNIPVMYAQSRVRFKFEFTGGDYGNHVYLDDININGVVGMNDPNQVAGGLELYPNPAQDLLNISLVMQEKSDVQITLTDLNGREIAMIRNGELQAGANTIQYETSGLASGMYLLVVSDGKTKQVRKLAIQN